VETHGENNNEFLLFTKDTRYSKQKLEKVPSLPSGLYYRYIKPVPHVIYKVIVQNVDAFKTWHERLGHPDIGMMRKIMSNSSGYCMSDRKFLESLGDRKFSESLDFVCTSCINSKLIFRLTHPKIKHKPLKFLKFIRGDICGSIQSLSGPFRYFMVLIAAPTRWSHVYLLSTRYHTFAKLIAQVIRLRASQPEYQIKSIRLDNGAEFSSKTFSDYYMILGIKVQHSVSYVHTHNGLAESLIKRIKLIARSLLQNCNLPTSCWGQTVLRTGDLIQLHPTAYHRASRCNLFVMILLVFPIC
jgi:hypothetical protein